MPATHYNPIMGAKRRWALAAGNLLERSRAALRWEWDRKMGRKPMSQPMQPSAGLIMGGGRQKRSLQFRSPLSGFTLNKQSNGSQAQNVSQRQYSLGAASKNRPNGTISAQFNNLTNGTTSGNLAFTINRPTKATASAYVWSSPITRILARNNNKTVRWQLNRGQLTATAISGGPSGAQMVSGASSPIQTPASSPPAPKPPASTAPKPAAAGPATPAATTAKPAAG